MKPSHVKIAAAADVALATIAAVAMPAMVDAGPSRAGNNQHSIQCLVSGMILFIAEICTSSYAFGRAQEDC